MVKFFGNNQVGGRTVDVVIMFGYCLGGKVRGIYMEVYFNEVGSYTGYVPDSYP